MKAELVTGPLRRYGCYIDGEFVEPESHDHYIQSVNPTTGEPWCEFPRGSKADVDRAVQAARRAVESDAWGGLTPTKRGQALSRIGALGASASHELARLETMDIGKIIRETRAQIESVPGIYEYFAGWPDKFRGEVVPSPQHTLTYVRTEAIGVVAGIIPWNSPLHITANFLAPALAAGNTVVLKPSEHASASILEFVNLLGDAGIPPGVVNVVTGLGAEAGDHLVGHADVDLVFLTGGTVTGRRIAARAAERPARTLLELGGKSPIIIFDDADLEAAARGIAKGIFTSAGQSCIAGSRCFLHEAIYDDVLSLVQAHAESLRIGDPLDEQTDLGPLAFRDHMESVLAYIESGRMEGATVRSGGGRVLEPPFDRGYFVEPTIIEGIDNTVRVAREEIFGPVLCVMPFETEVDAVKLANQSPYGLAAGVWTRDGARAHRVAHALEAGTVWINTYRARSPFVPFGGYGYSGYGKIGGVEAMREYSRLKTVWMDLGA